MGPGLMFVSLPYAFGNIMQGEVFGFLPKPFSLKQLATAVKEALEA